MQFDPNNPTPNDINTFAEGDNKVLFQSTILENVRDSVIVTDLEGCITYWNKGAESLFGYTDKEVKGKMLTLLYLTADESQRAEDFKHILDGNDYSGEWQGKRKDGTLLWIDVKTTVLRNTNGILIGLLGIARDITERKQVEEALRESEERFRVLADTAPVLIWMADTTKLCTYFNKGWLNFTGRSMEEEWGNGWAEGVHPDDFDRCLAIYISNFDARKPFTMEYRLKRFDGVYRWILDNGVPRFTPHGLFSGYIGSCIDITDQVEARKKIQESEARVRRLIDSNIIGVIFWNIGGDITEANEVFLRMVGYTREDLDTGKIRWNDITPKEYAYLNVNAIEEMQHSGTGSIPFEKEYIRKDGSRIPVLVGGALLDAPSQEGVAFILDITQQKDLERRKDEFISMASHELKTPVTSIKAFTQVLYRRFKKRDDEEMLHFLARMDAQLTKLTILISDMLDITRIQTGKLPFREERFNLNTVVIETVESVQGMAPAHQLHLESEGDVWVYGDKDRIGQVLMNLLTNAIKYSPKADTVLISVEKEEGNALVSIRDFGIGIAESHQEKIFEQFYQVTDPMEKTFPGLGIGLYISNEIVKRHNGHMWVKSKKGEGALFGFRLPLQEV